MQTVWPALGLPPSNVVDGEALKPASRWLLLSDTAGLFTTIHLAVGTRAVQLWTAEATIWYALDTIPTIPAVLSDLTIDPDDLAPGGVLLTNEFTTYVLPVDALAHTLYLVSETENVRVLVTALTP